ncbi:beta-lactamase family protein [Aquimarina sp. D1M17]|nr:beta-lactamase family protein [Aquimarina acroporae]
MKIFRQAYFLKKTKSDLVKDLSLLSVIICVAVLFLTGCSNDDSVAIESTLSDDISNQEFVKIIESHASDFPVSTQIAIAIIDNASTEFIGVVNNNRVLRRTNIEDKIFEIGSITKVFTGVCLSKLIATNEAMPTETLQSQFDFPMQNGQDINLLQLANHTSGLPRLPTNTHEIIDLDINDPYASFTVSNFESYFQNHVFLNSESGTNYEYSNLGFGTLGYILAQKRGTSFEGLLGDLIFEPLKMTSSTTLLEKVDISKLIPALGPEGNTTLNWNFRDTMSGAGSIKSSVIDLEKFVRKNFEDDEEYNLPQQATFERVKGLSIGLGWEILESEGFRILSHGGGTGGYSSYLTMDKNNKKAVIVLSNVSGVGPLAGKIGDLATSLLENISLR